MLKEYDLKNFSTVYVLGSWYGNMGYILKRCGIKFRKIINVDRDRSKIVFTDRLYRALDIPSENLCLDANVVDFRKADSRSLIICTSPQDIIYTRWFKAVPKGPLIVIQSRNNAGLGHKDIEDFSKQFPMETVMMLDQRSFRDPETKYLRFMKIGIK